MRAPSTSFIRAHLVYLCMTTAQSQVGEEGRTKESKPSLQNTIRKDLLNRNLKHTDGHLYIIAPDFYVPFPSNHKSPMYYFFPMHSTSCSNSTNSRATLF